MADQGSPPRIVRTVAVPSAPGRPIRPSPIIIPPRRINFNNANRRPIQMNPGGSPSRRKGGRRTRRNRKNSRKTRRRN